MGRGTTIRSGAQAGPDDAEAIFQLPFGGPSRRNSIPEEGRGTKHERAAGIPASREPMACGVARAIATRRPVRAFSSRPVSVDDVSPIVRAAMRGANSERWNVWVLSREAIERVRNAVDATNGAPDATDHAIDEAIRRNLYDMMGVCFEPVPSAPRVYPECDLFGAPAAILITSSHRLDSGAWVEVGMLVQNMLLLAQEIGLAGSVQCGFAPIMDAIYPALGVGYDQSLVCAVSLGHEDRARLRADDRPAATDAAALRIVR